MHWSFVVNSGEVEPVEVELFAEFNGRALLSST